VAAAVAATLVSEKHLKYNFFDIWVSINVVVVFVSLLAAACQEEVNRNEGTSNLTTRIM